MALITQSFFCITLICTIVTDLKFASNLLTQVSELHPVLYQGLKRKCFHCLCEQLGLSFAKYPKMCNIFILMAAMSIYMKNKPVLCLLV